MSIIYFCLFSYHACVWVYHIGSWLCILASGLSVILASGHGFPELRQRSSSYPSHFGVNSQLRAGMTGRRSIRLTVRQMPSLAHGELVGLGPCRGSLGNQRLNARWLLNRINNVMIGGNLSFPTLSTLCPHCSGTSV